MKSFYTLLLAFSISGCTTGGSSMLNDRVENYFKDLEKVPATYKTEAVQEKFETVFKSFKAGATESNIRSLYAPTFYFNDTFKTFHNIEELIPYMIETAEQVELTDVVILDAAKSDTDYYIRWRMHMKFEAKGKAIDSVSIGMTQLRFDQEGKIILHQDYWDGTEGFYQHLPYIGYFVRKVRDSL